MRVPPAILKVIEESPFLRQVGRLREPMYWREQFAVCDMLLTPLKKAERWIAGKPSKSRPKDVAAFLHDWFVRAGEDQRREQRAQAGR